MYGTVARMRVKPGMQDKIKQLMAEYEGLKLRGHVNTYVYQMDGDSNEIYLAVVFQDKAAYDANADSPEQDERFRKMVDVLDGEPEWHDGEIIYSMSS